MTAISIDTILTLFMTSWGKILLGFFAVGLSFFLGKVISTGLFISSILLLMLAFMYGVDYMFIGSALVCFVLGIFAKQGGV